MDATMKLQWLDADDWRETAERGQCFTICDADSNDIADVYHNNHATVPTTPEQAAAYCRMFTASPDLCVALERLADAMAEKLGELYPEHHRDGWPAYRDEYERQMEPVNAARAVLDAARGGA